MERKSTIEEYLQVKSSLEPNEQGLKEDGNTDKDENEELLQKEREDANEKTHLEKIFHRLGNNLETSKKKKLGKIYKKFIINEKLTNRKIKEDSGKCLLCFMFQIFLPIIEIVNLIGIFSIISVMNCCFSLFMNSVKTFLGMGDVYKLNFYKELYYQSMNEPIDFNVMFFMSFLGDLFLKSGGFIFSSLIFLVINIGAFFMIDNFDFKNNTKDSDEIDYYNFFNLIYIFLFYIVLFIGVGGSSMLSQRILVDSYEKLKKFYEKTESVKYRLKKKETIQQIYEVGTSNYLQNALLEKENYDDDEEEEQKNVEESSSSDEEEEENNIIEIKEDNKGKKEKDNIIEVNENQIEKIEEVGEQKKEEKKEKKKEKKKERVSEGKFDYFFLICITTIIGYFGKYYFSSILGFQLFNKETDKNYRYFFYYIMIIYAASIIISFLLYGLFCFIFDISKKKKDKDKEKEKKKEKKDSFSAYQFLGFTIYKETLSTTKEQKRGNFCLLCESIKNCCDAIVCKANCNFICCDRFNTLKCCCCCCCPEYNEEDYIPNQYLFCYCYQGRRIQNWFHNFLVNKTQEALIPYMTQYFFLQLFVLGFNKAYNERDSNDTLDENLNFLKVFIITFCLFFYITITFSFFSSDNLNYILII